MKANKENTLLDSKNLRYLKLRIYLVTESDISFPAFPGTTLRGGFGYAFKNIACCFHSRQCLECPLSTNCSYYYVFETPCPDNAAMMKLYPQAPHPFIIGFESLDKNTYEKGESFSFNITLVGKAINYLPTFILAFNILGKNGIGKKRGKYKVSKIVIQDSTREKSEQIIYSPNNRLLLKPSFISEFPLNVLSDLQMDSNNKSKIKPEYIILEFLTPTHILFNGKPTVIPEFHNLVRVMLRRLSALSYFHCGYNLNTLNHKAIIEKANKIYIQDKNLNWFKVKRYSTRQKQTHHLVGFMGQVTYSGSNIHSFLPLLNLFSDLHIGKHTTFGQGSYQIKEYQGEK